MVLAVLEPRRQQMSNFKNSRRRTSQFLLLARYIPNVAKRSIWDQCKYAYIDDRPATDRRPTFHFEKFEWSYLRNGSSHVCF